MDEFGYAQYATAPDPMGFAATASGPAVDDLIGPPGTIFDTYYDGTPMEAAISSNATGAGSGPRRGGVIGFFMRGDVHAAGIALLGGWMLKRFLEQ